MVSPNVLPSHFAPWKENKVQRGLACFDPKEHSWPGVIQVKEKNIILVGEKKSEVVENGDFTK